MRYLDPKNDLTFKKIFGQHPHILKSFLNAVLPLEGDKQIIDLEYLAPELVPEIPIFKDTMVDVRCTDKEGRQFIVEMQMLWTDSFLQRVLFNASKAYVKQLERGAAYHLLEPVYALSILNENFSKHENYHHHYSVFNPETEAKIEGLELVFVELEKFSKDRKNLVHKELGILWLRFLKEMKELEREQIPSEFFEKKEINEAVEYLRESSLNSSELEQYDKYWDFISRQKTLEDSAFGDGVKLGYEKGKLEEKYLMAKAMKIKGIDILLIAEITGLSVDEIEKLSEL